MSTNGLGVDSMLETVQTDQRNERQSRRTSLVSQSSPEIRFFSVWKNFKMRGKWRKLSQTGKV